MALCVSWVQLASCYCFQGLTQSGSHHALRSHAKRLPLYCSLSIWTFPVAGMLPPATGPLPLFILFLLPRLFNPSSSSALNPFAISPWSPYQFLCRTSGDKRASNTALTLPKLHSESFTHIASFKSSQQPCEVGATMLFYKRFICYHQVSVFCRVS